MIHEIIIAGFGGQGVMSMGQILAYAGMFDGKEVSWLPSYGPEQRGGTANVSVVISDEPVGSPVFSHPQIAVVLNNPSFDKFEPKVAPGGVLIVNESLVQRKSERQDIKVVPIPATELANELGEVRVANTILLGRLLRESNVVSKEAVIHALKKILSKGKQQAIPINIQALEVDSSVAVGQE